MSRKSDFFALLLCLSLALPLPAAAQNAPSAERLEQWVTVGKNYYEGGNRFMRKDHEKAKEAFRMAAKHDHPEALYYLGNIYQEADEEDKALEYYGRAAILGQPDSQMILGVNHVMNGIQMEPDSEMQKLEYSNAVKWLQKAAEQDNPEAMYWYGDMLVKGLGTEKDEAQGRRLIAESAGLGNPNGQAMLAALYWQGQAGLEKDVAAAYKWMRLSELNGNENAPFLLMRIAREMRPAQVAEAKKAAEKMFKESAVKK